MRLSTGATPLPIESWTGLHLAETIYLSSIPGNLCRKRLHPRSIVNQATEIGEKKGYDVYVLPGGSCVLGLFRNKPYRAVVGVACAQELKLGGDLLKTI